MAVATFFVLPVATTLTGVTAFVGEQWPAADAPVGVVPAAPNRTTKAGEICFTAVGESLPVGEYGF